MVVKQQASNESLVSLAADLLRNFECCCEKEPDSFTLLMLENWKYIFGTIYSFESEVIKTQVDASGLLREVYKHRNQEPEPGCGYKLRQIVPINALDEARYIFEWEDDEYCSAVAFMSCLCGKLSLRHHLRKNFHKAAMYAQEAIICANALSYFLPIKDVDRRIISKLRSDQARLRASAPRKKQDKDNAGQLWEAWQSNPSCYENKARFIADVMEKFQLSQNTARAWFDHFRVKTSEAWEAEFGKDYPKKH